MGVAASAGLTAAAEQSPGDELKEAFSAIPVEQRTRLLAALSGSTPGSTSKWQEIASDSEVQKLGCAIRGPLSKLRLDIPEGKKGALAIVACGSYSPPTLAHFRVVEDSKDTVEALGYHVVGGFMSPVHLAYGKKSLTSNVHRTNMVGLTLQDSDWISVDPWECQQEGWTLTAKVIDRYQDEFDKLHDEGKIKMRTRVVMIGGADLIESFVNKNADGSDVWAPEDVEKIVSRGVCCITRDGFNLDEEELEPTEVNQVRSSRCRHQLHCEAPFERASQLAID